MARDLDATRQAFGGFGHETSAAYVDPHENLLYAKIEADIQAGRTVRVLDLACGAGATSERLAASGAKVVAVDFNPATAETLQKSPYASNIQFFQSDVRHLPAEISDQKFDYVLFQRALDCMPVKDGKVVLKSIRNLLAPKGQLFMTVSSPDADYAEGYTGRTLPLAQRFEKLSPQFQLLHHFTQPICMYSKEELSDVLEGLDFKAERLFMSGNGSNKVIATPKPWYATRPWQKIAALGLIAALLPVSRAMHHDTVQGSDTLAKNVASVVDDKDRFIFNVAHATQFAVIEKDPNGREFVVSASNENLRDVHNAKTMESEGLPIQSLAVKIGEKNLTAYYEPGHYPHYM